MRPLLRCLIVFALLALASCSRAPRLSDEAYQQAVTSFYTALAALQTSQDVLARGELDRVTQIVPHEPAAWANLGLLLMRQQQVDEALQRLEKADSLAPGNAHVHRLLALAQSQKGNVEASIGRWRRAMELDPQDSKAPFALAQEIERQGGEANEAEAQRILGALAARTGNLAAQLELARLAAKRKDFASVQNTLAVLSARAGSWPADAQERLRASLTAANNNAPETATSFIFLKNVLIQHPEYRAAYSAVTTPRSEVGEPFTRFLVLANPEPQPAAADESLAFTLDPQPAVSTDNAAWASVVWLTGDAPGIVAAGSREVRFANGARVPMPPEPLAAANGPHRIAAADLNYDFRTDLAIASGTGLRIVRQDPKGSFIDVTAGAKLPAAVVQQPLHAVWPADVDTDGDLDLVLARAEGSPFTLRNNGDGTFVVQSPFATATRVRDFVWTDVDGEGVPDAVFLQQDGAVRLLLNLRGGQFREATVPSSFGGLAAIASMESTGDALMDVVGVRTDGIVLRMFRAESGNSFEASELARLPPTSALAAGKARMLVGDVDNNGAADLIVSSASDSRVSLGGADFTFHPVAASIAMPVSALADLDGDGRLELVGHDGAGARVARSRGQRQYHWQAIRPRAITATGDQRINSFGIGGEVEIRSGLHAQKQVIVDPVVHFGLGEATRAEVARITWPNGFLQSEFDLDADSTIGASQRLKGSCPWLFAWNGREMGFVTDFIWRSPLGLRINAQATADVHMTEEWVKVGANQLAPKNGEYDIRITAELWETHFFDLVSLLVVDHPAGTEVFIDERFAVPPPDLAVIPTGPVQSFASVKDDSGREVGEIVRDRDNRHLDFAGRGAYQGVTRNHYIELQLPAEAPRDAPLWLVAQGWVHPTDSSINVALSQGAHAPPTGVSLHVADGRGVFRPVRANLGFPAGKDKTILIDLANVFPASGLRRLRLHTNLEVFWDRLGWAVGRPDVAIEPKRLDVRSADLRYRGFSVTEQPDQSSPERPRYVLEGTAPRWRDLEGFHTRFGDVRELLLSVDDRYVIMNAGDELIVKFPEAAAPAPGMVRDFVVVGDGWEKDGDYNTTASRTVLPLPTHTSAKYGRAPARLEDDPVYRRHRADFERYHTRFVSPEAVRDALRARTDIGHP